MLPQGFAALYAFLGLVAPGLLYAWLREKQSPQPGESAFREVSRLALASLVFSWSAVLMLAVVSRLGLGRLLVDLQKWVAEGNTYLEDHLWLAAWSATAELFVACFLAWLAAKIITSREKPGGATPVVYRTPIYEALQGRMAQGQVPWVLVYLNDGTRIWGKVFRYTLTQAAADEQQLALTGPGLAVQAKGEKRKEQDYWEVIVVKASDIGMIKVATSS